MSSHITKGLRLCGGAVLGWGMTALVTLSCAPSISPSASDSRIELRWVRSYAQETWDEVATGVTWSLSFLGAELPRGALPSVLHRTGESLVTLDLAAAGFRESALRAFDPPLAVLKDSEEYRQMGSVDLGRFLVFTLHSPWHYYRITGAETTYQELGRTYGVDAYDVMPIVNSSVAEHERRVRIGNCASESPMAFVAEEGMGAIEDGTFQPEAYEATVALPNGQFRFAIFDRAGALLPASPPELGRAGKPGKCLWCHETNIQPLVRETPDVAGFMTKATFAERVASCAAVLSARRRALVSEVDFEKAGDHTLSELLYVGFMEPSAQRVAVEWDQDLSTVERTLASLTTHRQTEFSFLGELYDRSDVDALAPYGTVRVPSSVREPSAYEPDAFAAAAP